MSKNFSQSVNIRIILLVILIVLIFSLIFLRLYHLQILRNDFFLQKADDQHMRKLTVPAKRGEIFDRNGKPIAVNLEVDSISCDPMFVKDPDSYAKTLAPILDLDEKTLSKEITEKKNLNKSSFLWIKRKVDKEISDKVRALKLQGIYFDEEAIRIYPKEELMSHIIGFVGSDNMGLDGLEKTMNSKISGENGFRYVTKDAKRREIGYMKTMGKNAKHGYSIELTIDEIIQYIAESELDAAYWKYNPVWAGIVVMRPQTGEILAMATRPTYNPNHYGDYPTENRRNRVITDMFEPGSIFKIISCSSALNEGAVKFTDSFNCENGAFYIFRHTLHDCHPYGILTFPQVIAVSSNIGTAKIALTLGKEKLHRCIKNFDFGEKSNLPLLGESPGVFRDLKYWSALSTVCIPMGQEICITALQMAKAVSSIAHEGKLMQPYMIKRIMDSNGNVVEKSEPKMIRQVIKPKTAKIMNEALKMVVRKGGTGIYADIPEYTAAGKTGTAQKVENGRYSNSKYVGSFAGYAPADDPKITIMVVMDSPKGQYYGGVVSAPVFREVARKVLKYLEVPPEPDRLPISQNQQKTGGNNNDHSG